MITFEIKSEINITFEYSPYLSHRRGRKSIRCWHTNGKKWYHVNNKEHRLNRPSSTFWHSNGQKSEEWYYINGECQSSNYWNKQGEQFSIK